MITFILLLIMGVLGITLGRYTLYKNIKTFNDVFHHPIVKNMTYDEFKNRLPSYIGNLLDVAHSFGFNEGIAEISQKNNEDI